MEARTLFAHRLRDTLQCRQRIVDIDDRAVAEMIAFLWNAMHDGDRSPLRERRVDELVAVAHTVQRDEAGARLEHTRVEGPAPGHGLWVPAHDTTASARRDVGGRQVHAPASNSSRATTRSSKGVVVPPAVWPRSWPLPAISTTSPARATASASRIAVRRSSSTTTAAPLATPASTSSASAAGSSERGLSDVR